jgi:hypothetical protein
MHEASHVGAPQEITCQLFEHAIGRLNTMVGLMGIDPKDIESMMGAIVGDASHLHRPGGVK